MNLSNPNYSTTAFAGSTVIGNEEGEPLSGSIEVIEVDLDTDGDGDEIKALGDYDSYVNRSNKIKAGFGWNNYNASSYTLQTVSTIESNKVAENLADFAANDPMNNKTWARIFTENVLMGMTWYNPRKDDPHAPNLKEGWAFFEHITLARHFHIDGNKYSAEEINRAEPGERREPTLLYSFFRTPGESLNDWGIGVALYFNTMRVMSIGLLLAGLVSLPNYVYFSGEDYSGGVANHQADRAFTIKGSAVCTESSWVGCEPGYCDLGQLDKNQIEYKIAGDIVFVKKSDCDGATLRVGMFNYAAIMLLGLITVLFSWYQSKKQVIYDEDKVTATDYSVRVKNPPKDATDPDEWEAFFAKFDSKGVTVVTILLNNAPLLRALMKRRHLRKELQKWLPHTNIDSNEQVRASMAEFQHEPSGCITKFIQCAIRPIVKPFNILLHLQEIYDKLEENDVTIKELQQQEYDVTDVIITFETEEGQRLALETLTTGELDVRLQRRGSRGEPSLFRGKHVLDVVEPAEPSAMRYLDLDTNVAERIIQQMITFSITIGLVVLGGFVVHHTRQGGGPFWAGILTTTLNMLIPNVVKLLMLIEKHASEGDRQKSMYLKITIFRWVNTAITVKFVTPFMNTLQGGKDDLIPAINGIFVSEMFVVPILSILDIMGNLSKHFFAPRARTVQQMRLCFRGTPYNLAEKYTDVSKIVFLAYYYSALNPNFLFMGCIAIFIRYFTDKFCIMRIWSSAPYIGTGLADFSRRYFFSFAIVAGVVVSAYDWALFRFDRVCKGQSDSITPGSYLNNTSGTSIFVQDADAARVCDESTCCQEVGFKWPPVPGIIETEDFEWMSEEQRDLARIYGWTSFALVISFVVLSFGSNIVMYIMSQFKGMYKPVGKDQHIDFSSVKDIDGYIPQIKGPYAYPLLACNIDDVDQSLIGWNDPGTSYDDYNMIFDVPYEGMKRSEKIEGSTRHYVRIKNHANFRESGDESDDTRPIFSIVKHWSPRSRVGTVS